MDELVEKGEVEKLTEAIFDFWSKTSDCNNIGFSEKDIRLSYMFLLGTTNQFTVYDEYPALRGFSDIVLLRTPASYSKFDYMFELKHVKKSETTENKVEEKLKEGKAQIEKYMQDERLKNRPFKKYVIVYSGIDVAKIEEV